MGLSRPLRPAWLVIRQSTRGFIHDRCLDHAALIAFYAIFSFIPLLIILIMAAQKFLGSVAGAYEGTLSYTRQFVIQTDPSFILNAKSFLESLGKYRTVALILSLVIATGVFGKIEAAMNEIMQVKKRKHIILRKLLEMTLIAGGTLCLILSFILTSVAAAVESFLEFHLASTPLLVPPQWMEQAQGFLFGWLLPYLFTVFFFAVIYKFVPNTYVPAKVAFIAAIIASILFEFTKRIFAWYVSNLALYGRIYGQLESLIVFAIWVYLSSIVMLLGAEVAHSVNRLVLPLRSLEDV